MAAPHNQKRYGEVWPQLKIDCCLKELEVIKPYVVFSGGWAWHFMSPKGHTELKHAHDHKDIDIFVFPHNVSAVIELLKNRGFEKTYTQYDKLPNNNDFRRYEKVVNDPEPFRITIDFFIGRELKVRDVDGWTVVDPKQLITFYSDIHTSDNCFAVKAAQDLLNRGIDPVGREELTKIPKEKQ